MHINVILEPIPGVEEPSGRLIEIEDEHGRSVAPAAVEHRDDGTYVLRIEWPAAAAGAASTE